MTSSPVIAAKQQKRLEQVIAVARRLFEERGYEEVGIREISTAAGMNPMQLYRLGLDKRDLLAEVILKVNAEQITEIKSFTPKKLKSAADFIKIYLLNLYEQDIAIKSIRKEGAAFGWKWSEKYEALIIEQLMQLIKPIADALSNESYDEVQARCFGIWSLYYVGYRNAVMNNADARSCLEAITSPLNLLLKK